MRAAADAGVLALGVLAHDEEIHVLRRVFASGVGTPGRRPQGGGSPTDRAPGGSRGSCPRARRGRARTDRPLRRAAPRRGRAAASRAHPPASSARARGPGASPMGAPSTTTTVLLSTPFLASATTSGPTPSPGRTAIRCVTRARPPPARRSPRRRASSNGTTSAYFAWMSKRFASCGACARSPTHSRGTRSGTRTGGGRWPSRGRTRSSSRRRGSPSRCPG